MISIYFTGLVFDVKFQRKYKLVQKLEGSAHKSLDEDTSKQHQEESKSNSSDNQSKIVINSEDDNDHLKLADATKDATGSADMSNHAAPSTDRDAKEHSARSSVGSADGKPDVPSNVMTGQAARQNGKETRLIEEERNAKRTGAMYVCVFQRDGCRRQQKKSSRSRTRWTGSAKVSYTKSC